MVRTKTESTHSDRVVTERVVHAVAEARDVDPLELPPMYDVLDPDALNKLFDGSSDAAKPAQGRIVFRMAGCEVTVYSDGRVDVAERPEPTVDTFAGTGGNGAETTVGE